MNEEKQIPIEELLIEKKKVRRRAIYVCQKLGIKTARELAYYNQFLLGRERNVGRGTLNYLAACLKNAGLSFVSEPRSRRLAAWKIIGKENMRSYLLGVIGKESSSIYDISWVCTNILRERLEPYGENGEKLLDGKDTWNFPRVAFRYTVIAPLVQELVQEGKLKEEYGTRGRVYSLVKSK